MRPSPFDPGPFRSSRTRAWSFVAVLLLVAGTASTASAQGPGEPGDSAVRHDDRALHVHLVKLRNQPAEEAMKLVMPLLSPHGSVEIQPGGNTLVVRDTLASLSKMLPLLADFDHSRRAVEVEVWILRATPAQVSPPGPTSPEIQALPGLVETLKAHLPYSNYELVAKSRVRSREGEYASLTAEDGFEIRFRLGTVVGNQRLRLGEFQVLRSTGDDARSSLLKSDLNLWLDRLAVISLVNPASRGRGSALLVVVQVDLPGFPANRRDER